MSYAIPAAERESRFAGTHVAIMSINRRDRAPLSVPVWYHYTPGGEVIVTTPVDSIKWRLLEKEMRFSLCIQSERPPYWYISVSGPVSSVTEEDRETVGRPMAHRYLGVEAGDRYMAETEDMRSRTLHMQPEQWFSADYS